MAWYTGDTSKTAGAGIAVLSDKLLLNSYWSIHDNLGGNKIVYKNACPGKNSLFYLHIDDSNTDYMSVTLWAGWDEVTHAGIGVDSGVLYFNKGTAYGLAVNDTRFIWCCTDSAERTAFYAGQPVRFREDINSPVLAGSTTYYAGRGEGVCEGSPGTSGNAVCINDPDSAKVSLIVMGGSNNNHFIRSVGSGCFLLPSLLHRSTTPWPVLGYWDGVLGKNQSGADITDGDIVTINGVPWEVFVASAGSSYGVCVVRKA